MIFPLHLGLRYLGVGPVGGNFLVVNDGDGEGERAILAEFGRSSSASIATKLRRTSGV